MVLRTAWRPVGRRGSDPGCRPGRSTDGIRVGPNRAPAGGVTAEFVTAARNTQGARPERTISPELRGEVGMIRRQELLQQRPQIRPVVPPPADRTPVDFLPHLHGARRTHAPIGLVKSQTMRIPVQSTMRENTARQPFQIADDVFIADLEHTSLRQDVAPMLHQLLIATVKSAELGEIVSVIQ